MSVYRRGGIYWYEFEFAGSRIRESTRTNSKRVAKEAERKRRRDLELGINRIRKPTEMPLFKVAAQRVIEDKSRRRARNTGELYKYALKPIVEAFGGKLVCDISPEEIHSYQTRRLATGVSARTVNIEVGALRTVLKTHRLGAPMSDAVEMLRERNGRRSRTKLWRREEADRGGGKTQIARAAAASYRHAGHGTSRSRNSSVATKGLKSRLEKRRDRERLHHGTEIQD